MKKIALMALLAAAVALPAEAATKKKAAAKADPNDASRRLVMDALPSFWPTPVKIIYYHNQKQAAAKPAKKAKKGKKK